MVTLPVPINLLSRRGLIGNECCDTRSLICLLPAALFWYWQPAALLSRFPGLCVERRCSTLVHVTTSRALIRLAIAFGSAYGLCVCPFTANALICCVPDSSRASHLFAVLVGRTSCLKHLACTWRRQDDIVHQTHLILGFA